MNFLQVFAPAFLAYNAICALKSPLASIPSLLSDDSMNYNIKPLDWVHADIVDQ